MHYGGSILEGSMSAKDEDEPYDGFSYKGGSDRNTEGIWLWSEPFVIPSSTVPEGRVCVLLMDTQGMFDCLTGQMLTTSIFGMSTLLSSYQIYNVEKRLQEDHLQNLALFSEFALSSSFSLQIQSRCVPRGFLSRPRPAPLSPRVRLSAAAHDAGLAGAVVPRGDRPLGVGEIAAKARGAVPAAGLFGSRLAEFPRRRERGGVLGGDGGVQDAAVRAARDGGSARDAGADRFLLPERGYFLPAASGNAGHADELLGEYPRGGALLPLAAGAVHRAHLRYAAAAEDHQPRAVVRGGFRGVAKKEARHA